MMKSFKDKILSHEFNYRPGAWEEFEQLLPENKNPVHPKSNIYNFKFFFPFLLTSIILTCVSGKIIDKTLPSNNIFVSQNQRLNSLEEFSDIYPNKLEARPESILERNTNSGTSMFVDELTIKNNNNKSIKNNEIAIRLVEQLDLNENKINQSKTEQRIYDTLNSLINVIHFVALNEEQKEEKSIPSLKMKKSRKSILLNSSGNSSFRKGSTGFRLKLEAMYPVSKKIEIGTAITSEWYAPELLLSMPRTERRQQTVIGIYGTMGYTFLNKNKHLVRGKMGAGLQINSELEMVYHPSPEGTLIFREDIISNFFSVDLSTDYQYFFHPRFSTGINAGFSTGLQNAFYLGAQVGFKF